MNIMERLILCIHLLILQQAVTAQVTLSTVATFVEGSDGTFECTFTGAWDATFLRQWTGPGSVTLINQGVSNNPAKYSESLDTGNNKFSMTIQSFTFGSDQGSYQCVYGFDTSSQIILSLANTEAHPSPSPLDNLVIPGATEAIDLTFNVPNVRPNATASFNLTSSSGALTSSGNNLVDSVTADAGGETFSSIFKINVGAGMTADGDILAIELVVGTYSVSKQWTITEPDCNCDAVLALGIIGILISVVWMIFTGIVHFQVLKLKTDLSLLAAVLITVICVIALILCIAGIVVCEVCKTKDAETTGLILAAVGFVCSLIPIIMILLNRFGVLTRSSSNPATERDGPDGQEGKHSAAESKPSDGSNDTPRGGKLGNVPPGRKLPPLTATALDVDGGQKSNSLAPLDTTETKKLRKKKKRRSKEEKQVMSENTDNDQKEQSETHDVTLPNSVSTTMEESGENATAVAKHVEKGQVQPIEGVHSQQATNRQTEVSKKEEESVVNATVLTKLVNVPAGRKLPALTTTALDVAAGQKANSLAPLDTTEIMKLKKKKKRRSKEDKQVVSENTDNDQEEQNDQSETHDVTLPNSVCTTMEESGENATAVAKHVEKGQVQAVEGVHSQQATNSQTEVSKKEEESGENATAVAKRVEKGQVQANEGVHSQQATNSQTEVSKKEEESDENATAVAKHVEKGQVQAVEGVHSQQATNSQTEVSQKEEESDENATVLAKHVEKGQVQAVEGVHSQQATNSQTEVSKKGGRGLTGCCLF